jgi:hypothetical protein
VHVFVHTHVRKRTPRRATAELAAVAKPPTCLHAQVRTWTPPLAGQCSLTHARAMASPFCGQTSCELKPSLPTFSSSPGKPRSSPALPVQTVHAHVHAHAHPRKRAATPADTPVATSRSSSRTEPFTIAPPCSSGSFISRPHARACARPSCRLCSPCSSPVNKFARVSRT